MEGTPSCCGGREEGRRMEGGWKKGREEGIKGGEGKGKEKGEKG